MFHVSCSLTVFEFYLILKINFPLCFPHITLLLLLQINSNLLTVLFSLFRFTHHTVHMQNKIWSMQTTVQYVTLLFLLKMLLYLNLLPTKTSFKYFLKSSFDSRATTCIILPFSF